MKKRTIFIALALFAGLSSCDDWIDKEPLDSIVDTNYFKTETDLQLFSNNFYSNILDKSPYDDQRDVGR